jgi:DegV family protein with EDD domain
MNKVAIVTDSTSDLGKELTNRYGIKVLPLYVNFKGQSYKDGEEMDINQLFVKVKETGELPKTSAATPEDFTEAFRTLIEQGYDIVYTGIGAGFSASLQNANIAKAEFPENRIYLVDSQNLSTGIGILILKAAKLRDEGKSAAEIAEELQSLRPKVRTGFVVETLEYLHKGGRCSGTSRLIGTMLGIRPLIQVIGGKMEAKKVIGPMRKGLEKMLSEYRKDYEAGIVDEDFLFITDCDAENSYDYLREKIKPISNAKNLFHTMAGCVIGSHCGRGTIGIIYLVK